MQDYEKLGLFYLGKQYDARTRTRKDSLLLYDSRDLVTHAVCVGMTGSGKTGLCIGLLEEAAIDGVPSIAIDPKGDVSNLLLTFPQLSAEDFRPWINEEDARNKGVFPYEYANQQAEFWRKGLADWEQDGARIQRLKDAADFVIYTPGSTAGIPVSILKSFAAPGKEILEDGELLRERIGTTATSLLGMLAMEADPLKSRGHILLSTIFELAWKQNQDLDLAAIIHQIQTPPVTRIGVFDLESFFPAKDRFAFAMQINHLLAAPGFHTWMTGEELAIDRILFTRQGKPRVSIFSIAHLNDAERMFFVSLLLTQILSWMRTQPGTSSLRAVLFMDEIFGYFPPVENPPSKAPLLTLLKQARAYGLGVALATQNPVDLDYKGLSNAGTWFIGRLQTERDKARLLDGLEGAGGAVRFDRQKMEQTLAGLSSRIFLMNNVHEEEPEIFETRWALSYLRGPLARNQIKMLMDQRKSAAETSPEPAAARAPIENQSAHASLRPAIPPAVPQHFIAFREAQPAGSDLIYRPLLLGCGRVYYADAKIGVAFEHQVSFLCPFSNETAALLWDTATEVPVMETDLETSPAADALFEDPPREAQVEKNYGIWNRSFVDWLYRTQKLQLFRSPSLHQVSKPGENERDFRIRLQQLGREQRDLIVERLRQKYTPKIGALQDRIRRAQQAVDRESEQAKQQKVQTAISFGATVFGALFGRKRASVSNIGRATTAMRGVGRSMKESQDIERAQETVEALQKQLAGLETEMRAETEALASRIDPQTEVLETVEVRPKKTNILVRLVTLAWAPFWKDDRGSISAAF